MSSPRFRCRCRAWAPCWAAVTWPALGRCVRQVPAGQLRNSFSCADSIGSPIRTISFDVAMRAERPRGLTASSVGPAMEFRCFADTRCRTVLVVLLPPWRFGPDRDERHRRRGPRLVGGRDTRRDGQGRQRRARAPPLTKSVTARAPIEPPASHPAATASSPRWMGSNRRSTGSCCEAGQTATSDVSLSPARFSQSVVVTARRIEEVAQEVPIPVSVVERRPHRRTPAPSMSTA